MEMKLNNTCAKCGKKDLKRVYVIKLCDKKGNVIGSEEYCEKCYENRLIKEIEKIKLTKLEKNILKNIDEQFKYIARNEDGDVCVFRTEPSKKYTFWYDADYGIRIPFTKLFKFIKWIDDKSYKIEDLLKRRNK